MMGLYLDEVEAGAVYDLGSYHFTRDNMIAFAQKYDPQPFHIDDEAAARGPFGKLAASGWHTAAGWMKCYVTTSLAFEDKRRAAGEDAAHSAPSPGFTNLKWKKPVFAGDTISYRSTITAKRPMISRASLGLVSSANQGFNQHGEEVFSFDGMVLVLRRA